MAKEYVEQRSGGYYVAGTRISLASVVYGFRNGDDPETIRHNYSSLTLEQVYGAITYYLANQEPIDQYLERRKADSEKARAAQILPEGFRARRDAARADLQTRP